MKKSLITLFIVAISCSLSYGQWITSGNNIYNSNSGYVGIGTTTPTNPLSVVGAANFTGNIVSANFLNNGTNTFGQFAGNTTATGSSNTLFGEGAMGSITTGAMNTIIGQGLAPALTTGTRNIIIGTENTAWANNMSGQSLTTGYSNLIIGNATGTAFTTNNNNIAIGDGSLLSSTGNNNVSIGYAAGFYAYAGTNNAYIGTGAAQNTTGSNNAFMGYYAGQSSTGSSNTFMGYYAGVQGGAGSQNANFGAGAGESSTGSNNVFVGYVAGGTITTGNSLTFLGAAAGYSGTTATGLTNAAAIGYNAQVTASNCLVLGNGANVGIGISDPHNLLDVNGTMHGKVLNVDLNNWNDYVFNRSYRLRPLTEVKAYIDEHHHLPEVLSEAEMKKNGLDVAEINKVLTKKVEELTLYLLEKDKKAKEKAAVLKQQLEQLQSQQEQLTKLSAQMESLTKVSAK